MKTCPRCGEETLDEDDVYNSLSRRDNKTYICATCGVEESMIDLGEQERDWREMEFLAKIERERKE